MRIRLFDSTSSSCPSARGRAVAVAIFVASIAATTPAAADLPQVTVAAIAGATTDSLYGFGLGLRGGVSVGGEAALYLGVRVVDQIGNAYVDPISADTISPNYLFAGGEVGFERRIGTATIRPHFGVGVVHASVSDTTFPAMLTSNNLYINPGIVGTVLLTPPLFLGAELSLTKIFVDADDTTFITYAAEIGVKF